MKFLYVRGPRAGQTVDLPKNPRILGCFDDALACGMFGVYRAEEGITEPHLLVWHEQVPTMAQCRRIAAAQKKLAKGKP